jgi:DNA (cytosine-5)-methyltransferase 1
MEGGQLDAAPIWSNLKTFPWERFRGMVDILSGGYPCQPFSSAGKRLGTEDERHLWPYIAAGIRILQPRVCFFENVEGHISLGLSSVISDLEELGYQVAWGIFSASECGAPHQRKRVFILAHRNDQRLEGYWGHVAKHDSQGWQGADGHTWPSRPSHPQHEWEPPRVVVNPESKRADRGQQLCGEECGQRRALSSESDDSGEGVGNSTGTGLEGRQQSATTRTATDSASSTGRNGQTQPALGGDIDGPSSGLDYAELCVSCDNRTDELRLLGNGVVPATAAKAFITLINQL